MYNKVDIKNWRLIRKRQETQNKFNNHHDMKSLSIAYGAFHWTKNSMTNFCALQVASNTYNLCQNFQKRVVNLLRYMYTHINYCQLLPVKYILFHLIFISDFPEFLVKILWFSCRKFNNSSFFHRNSSRKFSYNLISPSFNPSLHAKCSRFLRTIMAEKSQKKTNRLAQRWTGMFQFCQK